jgi:hypothetical protein
MEEEFSILNEFVVLLQKAIPVQEVSYSQTKSLNL